MQVVLASTSPARLALMRSAGIEPALRAPEVDEDAAIAEIESARHAPLSPTEHVLTLARLKSAAVARSLGVSEDTIVIGGDSMFEFGGEVLGKPYEPDRARTRWMAMRGKTGVLHSGLSVWRLSPGSRAREAYASDSASVSFAGDITEDEIDAYVASGEPLHVAGAFTIDALAASFIERVEGAPSTVIGMSLPRLRVLIRELGVAWPSLWRGAR